MVKPKKEKSQGTRKCSRCEQVGHQKRTCQTDLDSIPEGHRLRLEQRQGIRVPDKEGTNPRKSMWIVSRSRKKVAGKIVQVKKDGTVVWEDILGTYI